MFGSTFAPAGVFDAIEEMVRNTVSIIPSRVDHGFVVFVTTGSVGLSVSRRLCSTVIVTGRSVTSSVRSSDNTATLGLVVIDIETSRQTLSLAHQIGGSRDSPALTTATGVISSPTVP